MPKKSSSKNLSSTEEALQKLRESGYRITRSREQLIRLVLKQKGHWNIQQISERVFKESPDIGIASISRTVNLLAEQGLLTKTEVGTGPARYEVASHDHHDHLTCTICGAIFEFENEQIERLQEKVAKELGFELADHQMELYGRCLKPKTCKKRKASKKP